MNPWNPPTDDNTNGSGVAPEKGQSLEEHVRKTWALVLSDRFEEKPPAMMPRALQDPNKQLGLFNSPGPSGRTQHSKVQPRTTPRAGSVDIGNLDRLNKALDQRGSPGLRSQVHDSGVSPIPNGTTTLVASDKHRNHQIHKQARGPSTTMSTFTQTTALVDCPLRRYRHLLPPVQLFSIKDRNDPQYDSLRQIFKDVDNIVSSTPSQHTASSIESATTAAGQGSAAALEMAKQSIRVKYGVQTENTTRTRRP
ncbi:hypothetical protein L211DRAFT_848264 [Terfezia boudieri ATCC MYA-4762]|uniref:Uncharacterized protein n=1 Tax=Terfezia boudieri ATCC MYA-4762 TaxID=1051890 RepID=A0A3N4M5C4_9PEZI|nr:hypothetical protein L211DRAFT_848264 [Terfezia boudieri ATCC MYA-4762]